MNDAAPRHPEAQIMAAFVEGRLAPGEIAVVAEHLRGCSDCRTVVAETARFASEKSPSLPTHTVRPWLLAVAALLAAVAITVPVLRWSATRSTSDRSDTPDASPIAHLIAVAPHDHRVVAARLSGFPWARLQAPSRGDAKPDPADLKVAGAAGEVLEKTADHHQSEARHATGVAYLLIGRRSDSIAALEQAARNSSDVHAWNDLAAARYAVAVEDERPSQLPEALADADHALRLDPKLPEALFNRALIIEHLGLTEQARKAWHRYLEIDPGSAWAVEARTHLRALDSTSVRFDPKMIGRVPADKLVREFPQEARTWGEGPLLAEWADAEMTHDEAHASAALAQARSLARALGGFNGEHLLDDAVGAIDRSRGEARDSLVTGQRIYRDARIAYNHRLPGAAEPEFRRAAALFARGGSPLAILASYYAANTAFDQNRGEEAHDLLTALLSRVETNRHRALSAEIHWELAVYGNSSGDWGAAARESDTSSSIFRSLGEKGHAAVLDGIAAMALELTGETDLAWSRRLQCFREMSATGERQKLGAMLRLAASTLAATEHIAAAASIIDLMIDNARHNSDPAQLSFDEAEGARFAARNGDFELARQSLTIARDAASVVSDAALREKLSRQIDLADATVQASGNARTAIVSLDRSITFFTRQETRADLASAYLQRARAHRTLGDSVSALADIASALGEVEKQRSTILDTESQVRFLDVARQILDEMIDLRLSVGDVEGAFHAADHSRVLPAAYQRLQASATAQLPDSHDIAVVEYSVLPQAVVAFCLTRDGLTAQRIQIDRHELESSVNSLVDLIRRRAPIDELNVRAAALHHLLIDPLRSRLIGVDEIVFVPDRQLFALPFAALWDGERRQYLAEEFTIRFATAATSRHETSAPLQPALIVAEPSTTAGPSLPNSRLEAGRIATLYGGASILTGADATRSAFTRAARRSALIHFAGHANSDTSGSYAALSFAATGLESGIVGANDVTRVRLDRQPLVVLAACGTFRGNTQHVAGMSSLARAFLLAGAREVVGTLWEIDDDVSAPLFFHLHEHLRAGASPARALRFAQLDLLHSTDPRLAHPATWAPVESLSND
jgi:CHAT domain-containing protein